MNQSNEDLILIILLLTEAGYFVMLLRTLITAYRTMARLRPSQAAWEAYILTGVDAEPLILKHWRTLIGYSLRPFLIVAAIRTVVLCYIGAGFWERNYGFATSDRPPLVYHVLLVFALGAIQLVYVTACGMLGSLSERKLPGNGARGVTMWLLLSLMLWMVLWGGIALYGYFVYQSGSNTTLIYSEQHHHFTQIIVWSGVSFLDSGIFSAVLLSSWLIYDTQPVLPVVAIVMVGYALLTWVVLRLSMWLAARQGMLSIAE